MAAAAPLKVAAKQKRTPKPPATFSFTSESEVKAEFGERRLIGSPYRTMLEQLEDAGAGKVAVT